MGCCHKFESHTHMPPPQTAAEFYSFPICSSQYQAQHMSASRCHVGDERTWNTKTARDREMGLHHQQEDMFSLLFP